MANAKLNPVFDGFSRSIGNLTFFTRNGKTYTRKKSAPTGIRTAAQSAVRNGFLQSIDDWKTLPLIVKESWSASAKNCTGYNHFIGTNSTRYPKGDLMMFSHALKTQSAVSCSAASGAAGVISVSFAHAAGDMMGELTLFYRKVPSDGGDYDAFTRVRADAAASGSVSIEGCTPGAWYEVQALLSDKDIDQAGTVSASAAMKVQSGA